MDIGEQTFQALFSAILRLLRPLVLISLKRGISYKTFISLVKLVFYDVAEKDLTIDGKKQTQSRISVITGFSRKEVKRLSEMVPPTTRKQEEQYNRAVRVISGWRRDVDYIDDQGNPKAIPLLGKGTTFESLVKRYSGDMPYRSVLDELERLCTIEMEPDNRVQLIKDAFTPMADDTIKFHILGTDVGLLISTIGHNIDVETKEPYFQRKVLYDNLPEEALPDIRRVVKVSGQQLLDNLDSHLSINDRDVNPSLEGTGRHVAGIGIYYFQQPFQETE